MITSGMFKEMLENIGKPIQPELIIEKKRNRYIAYFRKSSHRVGIGNTEIEALDNLKRLIL